MRSKMTSLIFFPRRRHNGIASLNLCNLLDRWNSSVITWTGLLPGWRATLFCFEILSRGQIDEVEVSSRLFRNIVVHESGIIRFRSSGIWTSCGSANCCAGSVGNLRCINRLASWWLGRRMGLGWWMGASRFWLGWWLGLRRLGLGRRLGLWRIWIPGLRLCRLRVCPPGDLHLPGIYLRPSSGTSVLLWIQLYGANKLLQQHD